MCFPTSIRIRCWFHRLGNIRVKLPDETAGQVLAHLYGPGRAHPGCGAGGGGPVYQHLRA
ncbi:MAG: hypothetical protein M3186_12140 [Actinomycetota bacterium]|nr:hypothetical protein [Actinomycetota bacterium]